MKVSFLVTFYNQKQYVEKCIESILLINKPFDWEILIGDNGSKDGTINEINRYISEDSEHIKLFSIEIPSEYSSVKKASINRINLIKNITGDYFCFIDGDDSYCSVDFVNKAIELLTKNKECSIVGFGYKEVNQNDDSIKEHIYHSGVFNNEEYISKMYIPAGACVYRNCFNVNDINILDKYSLYDDNDILLYNLKFGYIHMLNDISYSYLQHEDSVYHSMNIIEKYLLNSHGCEVDIKYLPNYRNELITRYSTSLINIYLYKKYISNNEDYFNVKTKLLEMHELSNSYTYKILNFKHISRKEKEAIKKEFINIVLNNKYKAVKQIIKHALFIIFNK